MTSPDTLLASLRPLTERVRTDITAVKTDDGSRWTDQALTDARLLAHLSGDGRPRGVCPIRAGEDTTSVGLLDFDSHKGETTWLEMSQVVAGVVEVLELVHGMHPVLFRSSGGRGVHLMLLWQDPQDAYSVRMFLRSVLAACDLVDGAGGVVHGQVEVFPRQNSVKPDGKGNQFILPLAGKSVPLRLDDVEELW